MSRYQNDDLVLTKQESVALIKTLLKPDAQVLQRRDHFLNSCLELDDQILESDHEIRST